MSYTFALFWIYRRAQAKGVAVTLALDIALMIMIGGFIGARLFHVLYESWDYYARDWTAIFRFWQGGFVFYGGLAGAWIATAVFLRLKKQNFVEWANFYAPVLAAGYAMGRIGCFLNGCCYGDICDLPWAVEFQYPGLPSGLRHPTQLYATLWEAITVFVLLRLERRQFRHLFYLWLITHGTGRIIMEIFRADHRGPEIMGLSISTALSFVLIACGSIAIMKATKNNQLGTVEIQ